MTDNEVLMRFIELSRIHRRETAFLSNMSKIIEHSAYQEIIALGPQVLPFLLTDLQDEEIGGFWFYAIRKISGEEIYIPPEMAGRIPYIAEKYVEWGKEKGYI